MSTRIFALVVVLLALVACDAGGGGATTTNPTGTPGSTGPVETSPSTTGTAAPTTTLPPGTEELPEEIRAELAELIEVTSEVRELEFLEQPNVVVVSDDELAQRVREQLVEDLEDLPADQALYDLLGLIEPDTDLEALYQDLYSEQVAGYYDGEVKELVVPRAEEGFTAIQRATLVHELTHSLTDQHYDFNTRYIDQIDNDQYDQAAAFQSLIEGDAVLAELLYIQRLTTEEQAAFFQESFGIDRTLFESAPEFIQDALIFPYDSGFLFVDRLNQTGGFDAIGEAYAAPPVSTEQVIDPDDYPADAPVEVELDDLTIDGYDLEYESRWGELGFALMFDQVLSDDLSDTAAGGWGGDHYQVHFDGTEVLLALRYRGDSAGDGEELAAALRDYVTTGMEVDDGTDFEDGVIYEGDDNAWVWESDAEVVLVVASDAAALSTAIDQILATTAPTTESG